MSLLSLSVSIRTVTYIVANFLVGPSHPNSHRYRFLHQPNQTIFNFFLHCIPTSLNSQFWLYKTSNTILSIFVTSHYSLHYCKIVFRILLNFHNYLIYCYIFLYYHMWSTTSFLYFFFFQNKTTSIIILFHINIKKNYRQ